ncbi:hypothetical protein [Mesorhizobium sp. SARCC-RB16n]|uniref:hypothetical protein n=1 Tax=Mesorhizobium sp. SARCC-RB16n TaxID=2116687 RepID=UPI001FEDF3B7|nr:hypothetical protein [Mesorhizobium sp. SARCC-RB16n]
MRRTVKALPFVPTEIHVSTVEDEKGLLGILSIWTTECILDLALDFSTADAIANAVNEIRSKLALGVKEKARLEIRGKLETPKAGARASLQRVCVRPHISQLTKVRNVQWTSTERLRAPQTKAYLRARL